MIHAVLMDMDGTLFDTEHLSTLGWLKAGRETGYPMTREQIWSFRGRGRDANCELFQSWFGPDAPYWEVRKVRTDYVEQWIAKNGVPLKPGLYEMLAYFKKAGLKTCLATGTARDAASGYWVKTKVLDYMDATLCGDEVTHTKPHPEMFLRAAKLVQTPPNECIVLEDSPNGSEAARRAGCHLIVIPDETPATPAMKDAADYVAKDLFDVMDYMKETYGQHYL